MKYAWVVVLLLAAAPVVAVEPLKIAVLDLHTSGIPPEQGDAFLVLVQDHLRNKLKHHVIGRGDIEAMLGLEKLKDMLACQNNTTCMAEIGGALGVDELLTGSIAKLGSYYVVSLRRINPGKSVVLAQATRKLQGASEDDLIDSVSPMLTELYVGAEAAAAEEKQLAEARRARLAERGEAQPLHVEKAEAKKATGIGYGAFASLTLDLREPDHSASPGVEAWLELWRFDLGSGFAMPLTALPTVRFWIYRGAIDVGMLARFAIYRRERSQDLGNFAGGPVAGVSLGWGRSVGSGVLGVRVEPMFAFPAGDRGFTLPLSVAAFWRQP